jgi:hypothetical protein
MTLDALEFDQLDVSGVQQVEAPLAKQNAPAILAIASEFRLQFVQRDDLALKTAMELLKSRSQFATRDDPGALLGDVQTRLPCWPKHAAASGAMLAIKNNPKVASTTSPSAGDIVDLARTCANVPRRPIVLRQQHTMPIQGHQTSNSASSINRRAAVVHALSSRS